MNGEASSGSSSIPFDACVTISTILRALDQLMVELSNQPSLLRQASEHIKRYVDEKVLGSTLSEAAGEGKPELVASPLPPSYGNEVVADPQRPPRLQCSSGPAVGHFAEDVAAATRIRKEKRDKWLAPAPKIAGRGTGGVWINIWPCFGTHSRAAAAPMRCFIRPRFVYMEDALESIAKELACQPSPSALLEPHGRVVRHLDDLRADGHYLIFPSGTFYRREAVPVSLLKILVESAKRTIGGEGT